MMARSDIALATIVGTIGGLGLMQQGPTNGFLSDVPEWLMPFAMLLVGILYGWNMWLQHQRAKDAPKPITREDLFQMEERIAAHNEKSLALVAAAIKELQPVLQGIQKTVSELKGALS